jgi:hypothetical protein
MNYPKKINIRTEGDTYPILIGKNILKNFPDAELIDVKFNEKENKND